jgi:hypothetical protein
MKTPTKIRLFPVFLCVKRFESFVKRQLGESLHFVNKTVEQKQQKGNKRTRV